jgi:hypothetical protein
MKAASSIKSIYKEDTLAGRPPPRRTATGEEVDFVLYGDRGLVAFEVKRSGAIQEATGVNLHAARETRRARS